MIIVLVSYKCKVGCRELFLQAIKDAQIDAASRAEAGNIRYDYSFAAEDENELILTEVWRDTEAIKAHGQMAHFQALGALKAEYVEETQISRYEAAPMEVSPLKQNLKDKTILFLGSSVTYGEAAGGVSFVDHIQKRNGCTCIKEAVSGTTLVDTGADSYIARMKTMPKDVQADLFVCQLSTNDATQKKPLGEVQEDVWEPEQFQTDTISGAMEYIIWYTFETYHCPVAFYTNPYYDSAEYAAMVELLYRIAEKWNKKWNENRDTSINENRNQDQNQDRNQEQDQNRTRGLNLFVIDLWNDRAFNQITEEERARFMADPIHPTHAGYLEWWTPVIEEQIDTMLEKK